MDRERPLLPGRDRDARIAATLVMRRAWEMLDAEERRRGIGLSPECPFGTDAHTQGIAATRWKIRCIVHLYQVAIDALWLDTWASYKQPGIFPSHSI